jgi:hypothetical protein
MRWLIERYPEHASRLAIVGFVLAALMIPLFVYRIAQIPRGLSERASVIESVGAGCDAWGAIYRIEPQGRSYWCGGGDTKCPVTGRVAVAYDPQAPARCRLASNVGRPSSVELELLMLGGLGAALWTTIKAGRHEVEGGRMQPGARRVFDAMCWMLALIVALFILKEAWDFARYGSS